MEEMNRLCEGGVIWGKKEKKFNTPAGHLVCTAFFISISQVFSGTIRSIHFAGTHKLQ
jgi:hypothetical protein